MPNGAFFARIPEKSGGADAVREKPVEIPDDMVAGGFIPGEKQRISADHSAHPAYLPVRKQIPAISHRIIPVFLHPVLFIEFGLLNGKAGRKRKKRLQFGSSRKIFPDFGKTVEQILNFRSRKETQPEFQGEFIAGFEIGRPIFGCDLIVGDEILGILANNRNGQADHGCFSVSRFFDADPGIAKLRALLGQQPETGFRRVGLEPDGRDTHPPRAFLNARRAIMDVQARNIRNNHGLVRPYVARIEQFWGITKAAGFKAVPVVGRRRHQDIVVFRPVIEGEIDGNAGLRRRSFDQFAMELHFQHVFPVFRNFCLIADLPDAFLE